MKLLFITILTALLSFITLNAHADTTRVLFVGNSYTYANDLPVIFKNLSASGGKTVITDMSAPGGFSFENHFEYSETLSKIRLGTWNYVVLQEQSQMPVIPYYRFNSTYPFAIRLDSLIKSYGQTTVFFVTWGREAGGQQCINSYCSPVFLNYFHMQDSLTSSYMMVSDSVSALLAPVGEAWRTAKTLNPSIDLWDTDGSHPSLKGSYLTACLFYKKLFNQSPAGLPYNAGLSPADALFLQNCAAQTPTGIAQYDKNFNKSFETHIYPNPFNGQTTIRFSVPVRTHCKLEIYDMLGRVVNILANQTLNAGEYKYHFDGSGYASGMYFAKLTTPDNASVKKFIIIK
ncbi:MAG: T9SS type A sorting domain-containing protein [Ignavibacteria bacterium]|nr:T9SS type A sorting domain-containing protein [Ignavibacteria bacterium]